MEKVLRCMKMWGEFKNFYVLGMVFDINRQDNRKERILIRGERI
jgi:hypothetical protein